MSKVKIGEEERSTSSDEDNESSTNSSSPKSCQYKIPEKEINQNSRNNNKNKSCIIEVYEDNFLQEMKNLTSLIKEYNYIGMDTEFPGIVYSLSSFNEDFYYNSLKLNVDSLKLIQLGITLSNEKGEYPTPYCTWQFNFDFDIAKDKYSESSLFLLMSSGIDFNKMKKNGINHKKFFQQFKNSGLVLNPNIHWISFQGSYDFAYLLSNLLGNSLPKNEKDFTQILSCFFPNHYDIRILVKNRNVLKGSLNKLANYLEIEREGKKHQAGSDSLVTIEVFWKLIRERYISKEELNEDKNIVYGILKGKDNKETIQYTNFSFPCNRNNNKTMGFNCKNNVESINNNYKYLPFVNNMCNPYTNFCYPQIMLNTYRFKIMPIVNNRNKNMIQFC